MIMVRFVKDKTAKETSLSACGTPNISGMPGVQFVVVMPHCFLFYLNVWLLLPFGFWVHPDPLGSCYIFVFQGYAVPTGNHYQRTLS